MASIYQTSQPPNPYWNFVNGNLEDHPFFAPRGQHGHHGHHGRRGRRGRCGWNNPQQIDDTTRGAQTGETNDPKDNLEKGENSASGSNSPYNHHHRCDSSGKGEGRGWGWGRGGPGCHGPGPFRGRGGKWKHRHGPHTGSSGYHGHHNASKEFPQDSEAPQVDGKLSEPNTASRASKENTETSASGSDSPDNHRRHGHSGKCKNKGHRGPGHHGLGSFRGHGPHPGTHGFPGHHPNAGAFGFGPRGYGHHHRGCPSGRGRHHGGPPFVGPFDFLRQLGSKLGFPINGPTAEGVDFTPSVDVFDTPAKYIVHVSLPGAKMSDLSIDYDADESVLHLAGVLYRPGVNENLYQSLVVEERGQHLGVFEREVRLGTRVAPAFVAVDEISSKLEEGVLNVTLPKIVQDPGVGKKEGSMEDGNLHNEKDAIVVNERILTAVESEESDVEDDEAREYVKVHVQ